MDKKAKDPLPRPEGLPDPKRTAKFIKGVAKPDTKK